MHRTTRTVFAIAAALLVARFIPPLWCGRAAQGWLAADVKTQGPLADWLIEFEQTDNARRASHTNRFKGEWALVTHQMVALGLAQVALAHPEMKERYAPVITQAALKSMMPEMRDFGTNAWNEDALEVVVGEHGHAYLGYSAMAVSMARLFDPSYPSAAARSHDALIAAYERRLLASSTGLIETYPGNAFPTDVAAVVAAIALHGRATGVPHSAVIAHWAKAVRAVQIDRESGLIIQRMNAHTGARKDAPRGSGTGLAAYFAGFADRSVAALLADGLLRNRVSFAGFGAIREYQAGHSGRGDADSGPVIFGVSVAATGFALASAKAFGHTDDFNALYRTTNLFGLPVGVEREHFASGGPIGNALLLAMLTSGPELAP